jgi:Fe-S-cluster containining protein
MPIVIIKFKHINYAGQDYTVCPFAKKTDNGCRICEIHGYKPYVCKAFPLGRIINKNDIGYIIQGATCGNMNQEGITIREWFSGYDVDTIENASDVFNDFATELLRKYKIDKFYNNKRIPDEAKNALFHIMIYELYSNYDVNEDFFGQFERNKANIIKAYETLKVEVKKFLI